MKLKKQTKKTFHTSRESARDVGKANAQLYKNQGQHYVTQLVRSANITNNEILTGREKTEFQHKLPSICDSVTLQCDPA